MNYNTMDYMPNGIIVSNLRKSRIVYINKKAKEILKITDENKDKIISIADLISDEIAFEDIKKRIFDDLDKFKKSEGIFYLKALDNTIVEISFCCVWEDEEVGCVSWIFKKATEVISENKLSFKELAEYLPSGIIVMDIEHELSITYANHEHYKILEINEDDNNLENKGYLLKDFIFEEDVNWVLSEIYLNLAKNEDVDIEFRMQAKDNVIKWVRLFGRANVSSTGERLFYSSLKDLSQRRSIHDKLHMERVLFHKITELTDETIFRLDIQTNIIHFLGKKNDIFGEITVFENFPESIYKIYQIYKDDMPIHDDMMDYFKKGIVKPIEMRYKLGTSDFEWYKITYNFIKNNEGTPISVIGKMSNIHSQKLLEEQAKTDLLTGLYNKITTGFEVDRLLHLRNDKSHAFFIIDIDNFKSINDNLGHHFGDMVLTTIADDIRNCFRKNDIIGRIGGDEFVVVMRDASDTGMIIERAEIICSLLNKTYTGNNLSYRISASVGVSMYPDDGESYEELYKKSDLALYDIKRKGKNGYKQYSGDLNKKISAVEGGINKDINDNRIKPVFINNIVMSTVLNLLYETKNLSTSLNSILEYLGGVYKVDKCYIFEIIKDDNTYNDRFRWYKNKETDYHEEIENINNTNLFNIFKESVVDGVFHTNDIFTIPDKKIVDILKREGVKSIFLVESMKIEEESIILGLEDCQNNRIWSEEEIITLVHVGRLIFTAVYNDNIHKNYLSNFTK